MKWWWLSVVAVAACAPSNGVEVLAVDFGVVALGATHEAPLRVRNGTRFEAKFVRVEQRSGPRGFTVLPGFGPVAAGGQATWAVRYEALQPGPVEAAFAIVFERGESEVVVRARGAERCEVPGIFFGEVRPGVTRERVVELSNPLSTPAGLRVDPVHPPFAVEPSGEVLLAPGETRSVRYSWERRRWARCWRRRRCRRARTARPRW